MDDETEIYDAVGGDRPFFELVERFYVGVEGDSALRALYPADLTAGKDHLAWFLIQRFGGPAYFNQQRGEPRLRMRHHTFAITPALRDAWMRHMLSALEAVEVFGPFLTVMTEYFEHSATFLINAEEPVAGRTPLNTV